MIFSRLRRKEGSRGQWMWKKKQRARRNREKPEREKEGEGGILCAKMNTGPRIEDVCTTQFFARLPSSTRFPIFVPALSSPCGIIFSRSYPRGYPMARYALRTKPLPPPLYLPRSVFRVYIRPVEFHFDSKLKTRHPPSMSDPYLPAVKFHRGM